jgi:uncharacterized damage-inducible protein DinB
MNTLTFDNETVKRLAMGDLPGELDRTRRTLERLPEDRFDWKPHPKSMSLHELSAHVVNLLFWMTVTLRQTEFDMASLPDERQIPPTLDELLALFDEQAAVVARALDDITARDLLLDWTLREGDTVFFTMPRGMAMRVFCISHLVHHRAQLGGYLRMLDVPLPQTYGPTADEPDMG